MATKKRAAVISDTVSPDFYFPAWYDYYKSQFGAENIYILTYAGLRKQFNAFELGGIWQSNQYNNAERVRTISLIIDVLLESYDYVIRVDTDEFLVPDPRAFSSLSSYLETLRPPYVTAMGYDIIQGFEDGPLDINNSILVKQRRYAYPYDALNKTCIVGMPMIWAPGFHFASVHPYFHKLYLLHLKRADLDVQLKIGIAIAERAKDEPNRSYYLTSRENIEKYNRAVLTYEVGSGWSYFERTSYQADFLNAIRYTKSYGGVYHGGEFRPEKVLVTLPDEFSGKF